MLYVVATPIGNLGDITHRAVEVLKSVDLIACEDTRTTRILTARYGIATPTTSYYEHNKRFKGEVLLKLLREGKNIALVSDAGTPAISDPGFLLVAQAREAGIAVAAVPGPAAVVAALSASGLPANKFFFEGFLPVKPGARKKRLAWLMGLGVTVAAYESPHRILKTLEDIKALDGRRPLVLMREITKKFEETLTGCAGELETRVARTRPRGEFVLMF